MNKNESILCYFCKIFEWLTKGGHFRKNQTYHYDDEAKISLNVWVTTFGPSCSKIHFMN